MVDFSNLGGNDKIYFKRNYVEVLEHLTPKFYLEEDIASSGIKVTPVDQILNTHLVLAENFGTIFNVSTVNLASSLAYLSGVAPYFVKQNNLTNITPFEFETKILRPIGYSLNTYETSSDFADFLEETLLPGIQLNQPTLAYDIDPEVVHGYLTQTLSWLYFLNTSSATYSPSSFVKDIIVDKIYNGQTIYLNDCLKGVSKYIYENVGACSLFTDLALIPSDFTLDTLDTFIDIIYSPLYSDSKDFLVQQTFDDYIAAEIIPESTQSNGPFRRLLDAISFGIYDVNSEVDNLNILYDIDKCPEQYLPYIAELIGWRLFGHNVDRWRLQLKNAVKIYKAKGTKKALQLAVDSVFGPDTYDLSGKVVELNESYIPNLIFYSLMTDSSAFTSFENWTRNDAYAMGVLDYSDSDMETNVRFVVDYVLLQAVQKFPELFFVGNKPFRINDPKFVFYYRGRTFHIPPWESVKYYRYCRISPNLVQFIYERLLCFGVSLELATNVRDFILEQTLENESDLQVDNYWLMFTTAVHYPSNYSELINTYQTNKLKYLPMWNGKSSHFSLSLSASDFTFDRYSYLPKSSQGLNTMLDAIKDFTPAHSIPLINLTASSDDFASYNEKVCEKVNVPIQDIPATSGVNAGYVATAIQMSSLGRIFKRNQVDSLSNDAFFSANNTITARRNNLRRRNFLNLIDKTNWFYRDGFNGPTPFTPSSVNQDNLPLGYIPSSCTFVPIDDYHDIPAIYSPCEGMDSSSVFSGVAVSSTFPSRGPSSLDTSVCYLFHDRGGLAPIVGVMHSIMEKRAYDTVVSSLLNPAYFSSFAGSADYYNIALSLANTSAGPNSQDEFFNFEFGRGIHQAYRDYLGIFGAHSLSQAVADCSGGRDIFSHAYGPLIYNSQFDIAGTYGDDYIASSFDSVTKINYGNGSGVLSPLGSSVGTYVASDIGDGYIGSYEFRNGRILDGIEFVQTSGDSNDNEFSVYYVDPEFEKADGENFTVNNPLIRCKSNSQNGLSRIRFDLKNYGPHNLLAPEHTFNLKLNAFVGREGGTLIGGGSIGIWIHTNPQNGYIWSWTPNKEWQIDAVTDIDPNLVKNQLAHQFQFSLEDIGTETTLSSVDGPCIAELDIHGSNNLIGMGNLPKSFFKDLEVEFDTLNPPICLPNYYYDNLRTQVHTSAQEYVIDVFLYPNTQDTVYAVFNYLSMIDKTEYGRVKDYTPEQLLTVFRFFKELAGGLASRNATVSRTNFETSGGSRDSYRRNPLSFAGSVNSFTQMLNITLDPTL